MFLVGEKVKTSNKKVNNDSLGQYKFQEGKQSRRINLNELLQRAKDEKIKIKRTNLFIFSGVLFSAALVIVIVSFL